MYILTDLRPSCAASLTELLDSDLGKAVVAISEQELFGMVLNDFYKPKMHKLYSALYTAVEADFQLKIRKTPFTLERISDEASSCAMSEHTMKPVQLLSAVSSFVKTGRTKQASSGLSGLIALTCRIQSSSPAIRSKWRTHAPLCLTFRNSASSLTPTQASICPRSACAPLLTHCPAMQLQL